MTPSSPEVLSEHHGVASQTKCPIGTAPSRSGGATPGIGTGDRAIDQIGLGTLSVGRAEGHSRPHRRTLYWRGSLYAGWSERASERRRDRETIAGGSACPPCSEAPLGHRERRSKSRPYVWSSILGSRHNGVKTRASPGACPPDLPRRIRSPRRRPCPSPSQPTAVIGPDCATTYEAM